MKVAIVHDYIKEYGGAERVLRTLADIYPKATIYTAFRVKGSTADNEFKDRKIKESWLAPLLKIWRLYSPLRFLTPLIWRSFDFSDYDLVIASSSWYITRGFKAGPKTKVVCYCHTPPRWLYGYEMSVGFTKYWPVKLYAAVVGHFTRIYDYKTAQTVDFWIANSKNVQDRIEKFYRKRSTVIYPPVDVERITKATKNSKKKEYYFVVSRLVGAKGLEDIAKAANKLDIKLKIAGESHGFADIEKNLMKIAGDNIELIGRVSDKELFKLYGEAKGFVALAKDEDFGMTPVEAMAAGTPVIAYNGGGFRESVIDGKTGILIDDTDVKTLAKTIRKADKKQWEKEDLIEQARKFSKERFVKEIKEYVAKNVKS